MTEKQKRFCYEYLVDLDAKQAAIRAGYTRAGDGKKLLENSNIRELIETLMKANNTKGEDIPESRSETGDPPAQIAKVQPAREPTVENLIAELSKIAFSESSETKSSEKLKALELLGKHCGFFSENFHNKNKESENPFSGLSTEELRKLVSDET
ncbi:MAG: terminase small subunit [Oscillospiraceae bacterium]|nr:terminase small subunit [Oscillospiraceae bacterium]